MQRRLALVLAAPLLALALAACGGGGDADEDAATTGATATAAPAVTGGSEAGGDPAAGEAVYQAAGCGSCHTLEAAGSTGEVGPNLDDLAPSLERTLEQVRQGGGGMPAYEGELSEQEIADVAAFVVDSTSG